MTGHFTRQSQSLTISIRKVLQMQVSFKKRFKKRPGSLRWINFAFAAAVYLCFDAASGYRRNRVVVLKKLCLNLIGISILLMVSATANAAVCANGVYAAGCAGPNGAVAVRKPPPYGMPQGYYRPPAPYHPPSQVTCVNGVYRAGCAGPNGAAVVHKTY